MLIGRKPQALLRMDHLYIIKTGGHLFVIKDTFSRKRISTHTLSEVTRTSVVEGLLELHSNFVLAGNFILIADHKIPRLITTIT